MSDDVERVETALQSVSDAQLAERVLAAIRAAANVGSVYAQAYHPERDRRALDAALAALTETKP